MLFGGVDIETYAIQGITPDALASTLNLGGVTGALTRLSKPNTIALSSDAASNLNTSIGKSVELYLGDGTRLLATVVATYGRGLGFGDVTIANAVLRAHTSTGLDDSLLVSAKPAERGRVEREITSLGLVVQDRHSLDAVGSAQRDSQAWASLIALLVVLGYMALAVVNTLVLATATRRREFTLLCLIGATARQVRTMTRVEAILVVGIAVIVGTAASIPSLVGVAIGISRQPIPTIPPMTYGVIVAITVVLGMASIGIATRTALRDSTWP
jgi:putative ABC transport system permease protein